MRAAKHGVVAELDALVGLRDHARDVDLLPRQPSGSLLAGQRASKLRGRGMDFEELRSYVPGDDVRRMDWRATARLGRPYVRSYREERDRPLLLVVDQRASMFFGSRTRMKSVASAELAALLAWRALARGDRVGALVFGDTRQWTFRPQKSTAQVQRICEALVEATHALLEPQASPSDTFAEALRRASRLVAHDALLVLISGFRDLSGEAAALLGRVRSHNDLLLAWITDPLEESLPDLGSLPVTDGRRRMALPTSDPAFRRDFTAAFQAERTRFEEFVKSAGGLGFELSSDADPAERLREVLGRPSRARQQ